MSGIVESGAGVPVEHTARSVRRTLELIVSDANADVAVLDGSPFDPLVVGRNLGQLYAMIESLALVCTDQERRLADLEAGPE